MPIVHVDCWKDIGAEKVKKMIRRITQVIADAGIPAQAVRVVFYEIPKAHWGIGAEPASENSKTYYLLGSG